MKKEIIKFVRSFGLEARYSGRDKTMYIADPNIIALVREEFDPPFKMKIVRKYEVPAIVAKKIAETQAFETIKIGWAQIVRKIKNRILKNRKRNKIARMSRKINRK